MRFTHPDLTIQVDTARMSATSVASNDISPADPLDCLIIGAGPAGLTAATYLARFRRRILVIDAGHSRARWIPTSHNCPGFPFGVAGPELLKKLRTQAEEYGVRIHAGRVVALEQNADGFDVVTADGVRWTTRLVILATGIVDRMPDMAGLEDAIARNVVRLCAICDGYEASDEQIAVYAPTDTAIRHAMFLRTFSSRVTVVRSQPGEPTPECDEAARNAHIQVLPPSIALRHDGECCVFTLDDGSEHRFDSVYPILGSDAQSALAVSLGASVDDNGELRVDASQQTTVEGLYAIGDVVDVLNQISVAVGHAAIAATAIHNLLPRNFRETESNA